MTIGEFLQSRQHGELSTDHVLNAYYSLKDIERVDLPSYSVILLHSENIRNEYQEMVESLQKAWELVGDKLRDHGTFLPLTLSLPHTLTTPFPSAYTCIQHSSPQSG